jgi:hypothetical protein
MHSQAESCRPVCSVHCRIAELSARSPAATARAFAVHGEAGERSVVLINLSTITPMRVRLPALGGDLRVHAVEADHLTNGNAKHLPDARTYANSLNIIIIMNRRNASATPDAWRVGDRSPRIRGDSRLITTYEQTDH